MVLQVTGPISLGDIQSELDLSGPQSLGGMDARTLADIASGTISMSDFFGASSIPEFNGTLEYDGIIIPDVLGASTGVFVSSYEPYTVTGSATPENTLGGHALYIAQMTGAVPRKVSVSIGHSYPFVMQFSPSFKGVIIDGIDLGAPTNPFYGDAKSLVSYVRRISLADSSPIISSRCACAHCNIYSIIGGEFED